MNTQKEKHLLLSVVCALLAALSNTVMVMLVKLGIARGETVPAILFWRSVWALFIIVPLITFINTPRLVFWEKVKTKRLGLHVVRAVGGIVGAALFFFCASELSLAVASLLFFTIPLFMPLVGYVWKRRRIPALNWLGLGMGFAGVLLVLKPSPDLFRTAALLGVLSGLSAAIGQFAVHLLSETEKTRTINFYYFLIIAVLAFGFTFLEPVKNWHQLTSYDYLNFFAIGVFGYGYLFFITIALKHGPPHLVTSFLFSAVLFAIAIDWLVWGDVVDIFTILGTVLIVGGVVLKFYLHKKYSR